MIPKNSIGATKIFLSTKTTRDSKIFRIYQKKSTKKETIQTTAFPAFLESFAHFFLIQFDFHKGN